MKRLAYFLVLPVILAHACGGNAKQTDDRRPVKVGGCVVDTITCGWTRKAPPPGTVPARLTLKTVDGAGGEILERCSPDLVQVLDSLGIEIYSRTGLIHIKSGACWPPWSITFRIKPGDGRLREALMSGSIAGCQAREARPERYGAFFITSSAGSSDLWTVWYESGER